MASKLPKSNFAARFSAFLPAEESSIGGDILPYIWRRKTIYFSEKSLSLSLSLSLSECYSIIERECNFLTDLLKETFNI